MNEHQQWHLSKSVPLSIILAVIAQTVTLVWFIAGLDAATAQNAREISRHESRIEALEVSVQSQSVSIARMDENIQAIRDIVEQISRGR